jgi:hypothetical protein
MSSVEALIFLALVAAMVACAVAAGFCSNYRYGC